MVAREYTRGARSAGLPGAPNNEETHPRPEPTPEPHAVRAVPEPATERLAVAGERSGPPSPSLPYQEMALVHQNQNQNPSQTAIIGRCARKQGVEQFGEQSAKFIGSVQSSMMRVHITSIPNH